MAELVVYVNGEEIDRRAAELGTWASDDFQWELRSHYQEYNPDSDIRVVWEDDND